MTHLPDSGRERIPRWASVLAGGAAGLVLAAGAARAGDYQLHDLVTDDAARAAQLGFPPAAHVDPNLKNPWGLAHAPGGAWYVANTVTGTITHYTGSGASDGGFVNVPQNGGGGPQGPTGLVYNPGSGFKMANGQPSSFLISNLDGSISGYNPATGAVSQIVPGRTGGNIAAYAGLGVGQLNGQTYLYAPNQITGAVDVYQGDSSTPERAFSFTDPGANPKGYAPYQVQALGDHVFVSYATPGPDSANQPLGSGFVSEFNMDGSFVERVATGGQLDSPWGMALAPEGWGAFGGDLLVGNFSHNADFATIEAYNLATGAYEGVLTMDGKPIELPGLWSLQFGDGGASGSAQDLYFTAGIDDEQHGLFGFISASAAPEPGSWLLMTLGVGMIGCALRRRSGLVAA